MTDILSALKECAENDNVHLTKIECLDAAEEIIILRARIDLLNGELNEDCYVISRLEDKLIEALDSGKKQHDRPTVNIIKWIGRWSIFVVALFWSGFLIATWEWTNRYYADAGAVMTIFWHAAVMLREWRTK